VADKDGRVVIVGAGHGGGTAAATLRQFGWTGPITLIGDEPLVPYHRPPLSKAWLKGEADSESLALRPESFYAEQDIKLRLDTTVEWIDRERREVALDGDKRIAYDHLILATGARARALPVPGADFAKVLALRDAANADQLKEALGVGKRAVVIGGGYIGLEVAASARALGAEVTVVEREARVLARVACETLSRFFERYHRQRGVVFEFGLGVLEVLGEDGEIAGVRLSDDRVLPADVVLVGIGGEPNVELAKSAGLACDNGVIVDMNALTSDPHVYAIGDMTRRPLPLYGRDFRLESVPNALEQAKQAAAHLCDRAPPPPEVPWFWSDQYDLKLQIAGLPFDVADTVVRGDPDTDKFAIFHISPDHQIQAVEAVNMPDAFLGGRQFIGNRKPVSIEKLRDLAAPMKTVGA